MCRRMLELLDGMSTRTCVCACVRVCALCVRKMYFVRVAVDIFLCAMCQGAALIYKKIECANVLSAYVLGLVDSMLYRLP